MIHLGRFVLIEINGVTGEGYTLMKSNDHKINGYFTISCEIEEIDIGRGYVFNIGEKYYLDVYDFSRGHLEAKMASGRKKFITNGGCQIGIDRSRTYSYRMSRIYLSKDNSSSNFQVEKLPVVVNVDLTSSAYKSGNYLKNLGML